MRLTACFMMTAFVNILRHLTLAIMGTGTQAEYHIKAMLALEFCTEVRNAIQ